MRRRPSLLGIAGEQRAEPAQRRQAGETLAQALHPAPFLIHGHQQGSASRPQRADQGAQLVRRFVVALEQDHPADQGVGQQLDFLARERGAIQANH